MSRNRLYRAMLQDLRSTDLPHAVKAAIVDAAVHCTIMGYAEQDAVRSHYAEQICDRCGWALPCHRKGCDTKEATHAPKLP